MNKLTKTVIITASLFSVCGVICMAAGSVMGGSCDKALPGLGFEIGGDEKNSSGSEYDDGHYGNGGYYDDGFGTSPYRGDYGSDDFDDNELDDFFRSFGFGDDFFNDFFGSDYGEIQQEDQL
ncbi:MAG: hypothetical protein Q4G33_03745 [bacterium]|nr:hypothetical protein [bacterium]